MIKSKQLETLYPDRLKVIYEDALDFDYSQLMDDLPTDLTDVRLLFIGNLPFNISTQLTVMLCQRMHERSGIFTHENISMSFIVQKEVAERMIAPAASKERTPLSVLCQSICNVSNIMNIPSTVFVPKPRVNAAVVMLTRRPNNDHGIEFPFEGFRKYVNYLFNAPRKTIRSNLVLFVENRLPKSIEGKERLVLVEQMLQMSQLESMRQPRTLDREEVVRIATQMHQLHSKYFK